MNKFLFWQKWIGAVSVIVIIFGIAIVLFGPALFKFLFNNQVNDIFWGTETITPAIVRFQKFIYGILGTVIVGWGIIMAFTAHYPFKKRERWAWMSLAISLSAWYFIDTSISIYYSAHYNALLNTVLYLSLGLPLYFTRKEFHKK